MDKPSGSQFSPTLSPLTQGLSSTSFWDDMQNLPEVPGRSLGNVGAEQIGKNSAGRKERGVTAVPGPTLPASLGIACTGGGCDGQLSPQVLTEVVQPQLHQAYWCHLGQPLNF